MNLFKKGSKGNDVRELQSKLTQLGYDIESDGDFGPKTEEAVKTLQTMFGYTVDGIVGDGTTKLIDQQIGYGWNAKAPDAKERALKAQGKGTKGDTMNNDKNQNPNQKPGVKGPEKHDVPGNSDKNMKSPDKGEMKSPDKSGMKTPDKGAPQKDFPAKQ